ncbi:hypothetical protein CCP3SC15_1110011 [Gammaproteobacteria bacterium]
MSGIRMTQQEYEAHLKKMNRTNQKPLTEKVNQIPAPKMSKTEAEYERIYLRAIPHKFEGITFKMSNGHRYTPDFYVVRTERGSCQQDFRIVLECHEIKGGYRLGSYGRARLAFDQARIEYPDFKFIWATKTKEGWRIQ